MSLRCFFGTLLTIASGAATAAAQTPDRPPKEWISITEAIRGHEWADGINNLLDIVEAMPDSLYAYRPLQGMRSFGELVGHIADVQFYFCDLIAERRSRPDKAATAGKPQAIGDLRQSIEACDSVMDNMTDARLVAGHARFADNLTTMIGHTRRETGKLVTYLRLAGIEPPELKYYRGRTWRQ